MCNIPNGIKYNMEWNMSWFGVHYMHLSEGYTLLKITMTRPHCLRSQTEWFVH